MTEIKKSWFAIDGGLEPIDYAGENNFRFPAELAEIVLKKFSKEGDWVLDPFCGFGTTLKAAQKMNRKAIGFEADGGRATFANKGLNEPNKAIHEKVETIDQHSLPFFDLVFTSPPYVTVRLEDDPWGLTYFEDMESIFGKIKKTLKPDASVVIEVSNIRTKDGVRPLAWQFGEFLSKIFAFQGEIIRVDTGDAEAGPGFDHSYLLVYKNK